MKKQRKPGQTIFIRKGGRVIPIKVKKGSALSESRKRIKTATNIGNVVGAVGGVAAATSLFKKRATLVELLVGSFGGGLVGALAGQGIQSSSENKKLNKKFGALKGKSFREKLKRVRRAAREKF